MEDVLLIGAALLSEDERVAAEVRRQYKWFTVDEFQDVSPIQSALLDLWLGGRDEICVVGDPAQTIYSFAGASALPHRVPGEVPARTDDRAGAQLPLHAPGHRRRQRAAEGLGSSSGRAALPGGPGPAVTWRAAPRRGGRGRGRGGRDHGTAPARRALREMAVLFRINAQSESFEEALTARGIAYVVRGAARFFERQEVRQALALMRGTARGGAAARRPDRAGRAVLAGMGWSTTPRRPAARRATGGSRCRRWSPRRRSRHRRRRGSRRHAGRLRRRARPPGAEQHAPVAEGVTLATLHAAKGLEWDAVFLCGMQEGSMPITYARLPAAVEEERRLLYVGVTRARRHLWVSWAAARNPAVRPAAGRRGSSAGLRPESATDVPGGPRPRPGKKPPCASSARSRSARNAAQRKNGGTARTVRCPTTRSCSSGSLLAQGTRRRGEGARFRGVLRCHARGARRGQAGRRAGLQSISGIGKAKLDRYAGAVLALVAASRGESFQEFSRNTQ